MVRDPGKADFDDSAGRREQKVNWDDSNMSSSYANVVNVAGTREEVILLFGTNETWHAGQDVVNVRLSDRIVLNPFAAKRLLILLTRVIKQYEERIGPIDIEKRIGDDLSSE